jgi:2-polyprenyl-6-methoxyphenol hydroxylase-like FAD-dependent oxidoreductase
MSHETLSRQTVGSQKLGSPILCADVVIVGAGIAGSVLAHVLARQGVDAIVVDLHGAYPADFRCEKFNPDQIELLRELGVLDCLQAGGDLRQRGLRYEAMVNAVRGDWPDGVTFIEARVQSVETSADLQRLTLSTGEVLEARLVVLATGPSLRLREQLGLHRRVLRERQSVSIGFSVEPEACRELPVGAFTQHGERAGDQMAFASLFPMDGAFRINVFSYHDPRDGWVRRFRDDPIGRLCEVMPSLKPALSDLRVVGPVEIRGTDLYATEGHLQDGLALIGDAFCSSCPATGMGVSRALTDVRQLAFEHLPTWLASPGMGRGKIAQFYQDPAKLAVDGLSTRRSQRGRAVATLTSPRWRAYRALAGVKRQVRRLAAMARAA